MPAESTEGSRPNLGVGDLCQKLWNERSICTALRSQLQSEQRKKVAEDIDITKLTPLPNTWDFFARWSAQRALTEEMMKASPFQEYLRFGGLTILTAQVPMPGRINLSINR